MCLIVKETNRIAHQQVNLSLCQPHGSPVLALISRKYKIDRMFTVSSLSACAFQLISFSHCPQVREIKCSRGSVFSWLPCSLVLFTSLNPSSLPCLRESELSVTPSPVTPFQCDLERGGFWKSCMLDISVLSEFAN